jgi:hypothetical protein
VTWLYPASCGAAARSYKSMFKEELMTSNKDNEDIDYKAAEDDFM